MPVRQQNDNTDENIKVQNCSRPRMNGSRTLIHVLSDWTENALAITFDQVF